MAAAGVAPPIDRGYLCRERLTDDELATHCLSGDWDTCYIGVLAAIAAEMATAPSAKITGETPNKSFA
jgi:hypothetical protein